MSTSAAGFTVWVTGPDPRALETVADAVASRLALRRLPVETLDGRTPGIDVLSGAGLEERMTFVAGLLARHGVAAVIALGGSRAARDRARLQLGRMIEVHVQSGEVPSAGYEPPDRPEIEIVPSEAAPGAGPERVLHTLEVLGLLARDETSAYSEEEEREVIRRLKSFGYL
jgi:hypothetical protein